MLVDTVTKFCYAFLTKTRDEFKAEYITWSKHIFNKTGRFPAYIRVDQAGELTSKDMLDYFELCGTKPTVSNTEQSNQNAFAERLIGVLWMKTKIILTQCGLPFTYWCYAFAYVANVYNHTPNRTLNFKRPVDLAGVKPFDNLFKPFGVESYHYKVIDKKNEVTGHRSVFLGFDNFKRGYYFLDLTTRKVVSSRTALFRLRSRPFITANRGIPLPIDVVTWPMPTEMKRKEEREGIISLPPNTISVPPTLVEPDTDQIWDEFMFKPKPFDSAVDSIPSSTTNSKLRGFKRVSEWVKSKFSSNSINTPELSPIVKDESETLQFSPAYFPTIGKSSTDTSPENDHHINGTKAYEVERILDHQVKGRGRRYQVKWKHYDEPTWEPGKNLEHASDLVEQYNRTLDTKKCLVNDFENTTALDNDETTKQRVLAKFNPLNFDNKSTVNVESKKPSHSHRYPTRTKVNQKLPTIQEDTCIGQSDENQNDLDVPIENTDQHNPRISIPILSVDTPTDEVKIDPTDAETVEANLTAESVLHPPDYSGHVHYTPKSIDLNKILNYAFQASDGDDLFDMILDKEKSLLEKPPKTQNEMLKGNRVKEYIKAEERELTGIIKHGTWKVVIQPKDREPITCRWCYDIKRNNQNEIIFYKARLVVHGYKQVEGVDYTKTFSSTAQMRSFRTIVMLAEAFDLDLLQYDISNAFLNGELEDEIYIEYPPGYPGEPGTCLKLLKGLYGLKQAARIWNKVLNKVLGKSGLKVCKTEPGILYHPEKMCFVCLHVDDIIIATDDTELRKHIEDLLKANFLVKELGELTQFVGVEIIRTKSNITLRQTAYTERVWTRLKDFVIKCKGKIRGKTPNTTDKLSKLDVPIEPTDDVLEYPFPSVVGSLMYLVVATRPDLLQPVVQLARFMAGWGDTHITAANKALKFMHQTSKEGIVFTKPPNFDGKLKIMCFSDSDWAGCPDTRRSTIGYTIIVCGGPISWKSQLRKTLAHSSCEAEYMALSELGREIIWLCNFLDEIGVPYHTPQIYCDSSSAINWSEDPIQHQRTKHVEIDYYYIRDIVAAQRVHLFKIDGKENPADIFTKNVDPKTYHFLKPFIMGWEQVVINNIK